ncbi:MAG: hypothetical protein V1661_00940 [bacterium]
MKPRTPSKKSKMDQDTTHLPRLENTETKGKKEMIICPKCRAVYFDKHWHYGGGLYKFVGKNSRQELCPEDKPAASISYKGELILKNIPPAHKEDILNQIRNIGKRAEVRDPEDKIIKIEIKGGQIRVLTTENQLVANLGRQIDRAHKGGKLEIKWSKGDKLARVVWTAE